MKKIDITIDTRDAVQSISDLESQLKLVKEQMGNVEESQEDLNKETEDLGNRYSDLSNKLLNYERESQNVSRAIQTQSTSTTQLNRENSQSINLHQQLAEKALKAAESFKRMIDNVKTLTDSFSDGSKEFGTFSNIASSTSRALADIASKNYVGAIVNLVSAWRDWGEALGFTSDELDKFAMYVRATGTVIAKFLIAPLKAVVSLCRGEFKQALRDIREGFSFADNWNESIYNSKIKQAWKQFGDDAQAAFDRAIEAGQRFAGETLEYVISQLNKTGKSIRDNLQAVVDSLKKEKELHQERLDQINEEIAKEAERAQRIRAGIEDQKKGITETTEALRKADDEWGKASERWRNEGRPTGGFFTATPSSLKEMEKWHDEVERLTKSLNEQKKSLEQRQHYLGVAEENLKEYREEAIKLGATQNEIDEKIKEAEETIARTIQAEEEKIRKAKEQTVGTAEWQAAQEKKAQEERVLAASEAYNELKELQEEWRRNSLDSFDREIDDLQRKRDELINTIKSTGNEKDISFIPDIEALFKEQIDKVEAARTEYNQKQEAERQAQAQREKEIAEAATASRLAAEKKLEEERARIWKEFTTRTLSEKDRELQGISDLETKYLDSLNKNAADYESKRTQITQWAAEQRSSIEEKYIQKETQANNALLDSWNRVFQQITDSRLSEQDRALAEIDRQEQEWLDKYGELEDAKTEITQYAEEQRQKIRDEYREKEVKENQKESKETLKSITDMAAGASGALQTLTAGFSLLGFQMGDDIKVIKTLQSLMAMTSGIVAVEKGVVAFKKLGNAIKLSTVYTKAATVATTNFSKALLATGIGALVVALGTLLTMLPDIIKKMTEVSDTVKNQKAETEAAIKANEGWEDVIDYQTRLRKAYGDTTEQIRILKGELLQQKLDEAYDAYEKALSRYNKKVEEMGNTSNFAYAKMSRLKKECNELSEAVRIAGEQVSKVQDQIWKNTLDNLVDEAAERRSRLLKSITTERQLIEGRLKLDIAYFEHLRQLININYTNWKNNQEQIFDPNKNKIPEYQEQLNKITKILDTYQKQIKAVEDSREKRRKALKNELNQRLANQEITKRQMQQELKEFDQQEQATMDALNLQISQLNLEWTEVNNSLEEYRRNLVLSKKIAQDSVEDTIKSLDEEMKYRSKMMEYMKPDPSWYEPVQGWWNELDIENLQLEHEQAQLDLQNQMYQKDLENLQYQLDNKLISYEEYYQKVAEIDAEMTRNEQTQAELRIQIAKNEADKKKIVNNLYYRFLQNITASISSILGSVADTLEEGTTQWKALKYAQVIIDTLAGSISAFVSNLSAFPAPYNLIAGGVAAASVIATGIATANQIANTEVSKNATPNSNASVSYLTTNISNVRQTTTASDFQELRDNDMSPSDIRVIVYESDITNAQNRVRANVEENTF